MLVKPTRMVLLALALSMASVGSAAAAPRRGVIVRGYVARPFFYDPFWGSSPYWYRGYPAGISADADVKVQVTPKQAEVFVDGFYAGHAEDFDGVFKRLHTTPGGHAITLFSEGYRTITDDIYVAPDHTYQLHESLERLGAGQNSERPPLPSRPLWRSLPSAGSYRLVPEAQ
jgi:hypothetical protein